MLWGKCCRPDCPVKTSHEEVQATAYVKEGKTLIALASWVDEPVECKLFIDWNAVGLNPAKARLEIPQVHNFQEGLNVPPSKSRFQWNSSYTGRVFGINKMQLFGETI